MSNRAVPSARPYRANAPWPSPAVSNRSATSRPCADASPPFHQYDSAEQVRLGDRSRSPPSTLHTSRDIAIFEDVRTAVAKRLRDGTLVEVLPGGSTRRFPPDRTDWAALSAMTDAQINAAALSDPDKPAAHSGTRGAPQARASGRWAMDLSQEDFSACFRIPLGRLRDWEQGKSEPDQAARAYLTVIARDPEAVRRALQSDPAPSAVVTTPPMD